MKWLVLILVLGHTLQGLGQFPSSMKIGCDSVFTDSVEVHTPLINPADGYYYAATDLTDSTEWKNKDTIHIWAFTKNNVYNGMQSVEVLVNKHSNNITFGTTVVFPHGEYGQEYPGCKGSFLLEEDSIIIRETKYNYQEKPYGKKYKYRIEWVGKNCCRWIRTN